MPRIDPHQLLTCLGVLLTPNGGIKSKDEVQRLSSLMTKFSKKLVSKCVYILILKNTDTELLGQFMSVGGWNLTHLWLTDGICNNNWPLVSELLELMLMCPVDVERLKANNCPKLVKGLSKEGGPEGVRILASKLVEQWLKVVKGEAQVLATAPLNPVAPELAQTLPQPLAVTSAPSQLQQQQPELIPPIQTLDSAPVVNENNLEASTRLQPNQTVYKVTVRDGKQLIAKVDLPSGDSESGEKGKKEQKEKSKHSSSSKHSSKSSSSSNSSKKSSSRDKSKDKERDRSKGSSRDKDRDSSRSNGALKKSSSHSSSSHHHSNKDKQAEKDKATLAKLQPQSLNKIGRIPKKQSTDDDKKKSSGSSPNSKPEAKKTSISIEVRKRDAESRPKTVKIFNSKMRSTGLEEEAKPAPPRPVPKKLPSPKRMSPMHEKETTLRPPPEKKPKYADLLFDRPGGVKHIEPKAKPVGLQECGLFMDAMVAASTNNKKDPKKKKRRMSVTKEDNAPGGKSNSPPHSPPVTPSTTGSVSPVTSPTVLKTPIPKFYKDTLETDDESDPKSPKSDGDTKKEDDKDAEDVVKDKNKDDDGPKSPDDALSANEVKTEAPERKSGGVLVLTKRKGPKKTVSWKNDSELEVIQYFELDETERVNVTKTFTDMKQIEMSGEREAVQLSRKLPNEDMMDERMLWRKLVPIDVPVELVQLGKNSKEKDIQHSREKVILQALYFHRSMIPDSPTEPDVEHHPMEDAVVIPLDDVAGNPDSVKDYTMTPWPESKGEAPTEVSNFNSGMPNFTAPIQPPFIGMPPPGGFPPGMPGPPFPGPQPGFWRPPGPDMNMNPEMFNRMGIPPPGMFHGGQPAPNGFGMPPNGPFPPPQAFNGPPGMFPPGAPHFTERGGHVNMRMGNRNGMWFRKNVPKKWKGVDWNNTDVCKHFQRIGYCRQGDKCQFLHPGVNCPPFD